MNRTPGVVDSIASVVMALGFLVFMVDAFTDGGLRRTIRERINQEETPAPEPHRENQTFGIARAAEEITRGAIA